jgi:uncharacterized membrane protein YjjB (DUF3815 family)
MSSFVYVKNVPPVERGLRIVFSLAVAAFAVGRLASPWSFILAASALGFTVTGFVGFCPLCAMVGRRIAPSKP